MIFPENVEERYAEPHILFSSSLVMALLQGLRRPLRGTTAGTLLKCLLATFPPVPASRTMFSLYYLS